MLSDNFARGYIDRAESIQNFPYRLMINNISGHKPIKYDIHTG